MRQFFFTPLLMGLFFSLSQQVAAGDAIYTGTFSNKAVGGYDPVSYFTEGKPVKGHKDYTFGYQGAQWLFSSAENRDRFKAMPESYSPQYGGFCSWAVSAKKSRAPGDPEIWTIVDGKLYLNYNKTVQDKWLDDIPGHIATADKNWPALLAE